MPRELPLPSCPSGHIVCRPCKTRVTDCPTCRQPMPANMTNSVVGALIDQIQHSCKYNDQGCEVKMMLKDLLVHEKRCPERTILCPYNTCGTIVKLKAMNEHFLRTPGVPSSHSTFNSGFPSASFKILRFGRWQMVCVKADDELFHLRLGISQSQNCFALSVWGSPTGSAKYQANLSIRNDKKDMCMNGLDITSVENVPSIDKCMDENGTYFWCIPFTLAENFSIKESNDPLSRLHVDWDVIRKS